MCATVWNDLHQNVNSVDLQKDDRNTCTSNTYNWHSLHLLISFLTEMDIMFFVILLSEMMKASSFIYGIKGYLKVYIEDQILLSKRAHSKIIKSLPCTHAKKTSLKLIALAVSVYLNGTRTASSGAWPLGAPRQTAPRSRSVPSGNTQTAQKPLQDKGVGWRNMLKKKKNGDFGCYTYLLIFPKSHDPKNPIKLTTFLCFLKVSSC